MSDRIGPPRFTPPPIGVPFNEKETLSLMLASDVEQHLRNNGKIVEVPAQPYIQRSGYVRAGVSSGLSALDQFLMSSD